MDRRRKQELAYLFEAPTPLRKREFLRTHRHEKISMQYMLRMQLAYISRWTWCLFAFLVGVTTIVSLYLEPKMQRIIFALIPFLVMVSVIEMIRSNLYQMNELEMACRFSLKSIILARMSVLGIGNLIVMIVIVYLLGGEMFKNAMNILAIYLVTSYCCLCIVRKVPNREGTYLCGAVACFISLSTVTSTQLFDWIFEMRYLGCWLLVLLLFMSLTIREGYRTIRRTEEFICS